MLTLDPTCDARERVTRDRIVAAAAELMATRGYRGTALADVGASLGVSRQAIYHHFANKPRILAAIFHTLFDRLLEESERICQDRSDADRFRALLNSHLEIVLRDRELAAVAIKAHRELPAAERPAASAIRARYLSNLRDAYAAGVSAAVLRDVPPAVAVRIVIGTVNWATRWFRESDTEQSEQVRTQIYTLLLRGAETIDPRTSEHQAAASPSKKEGRNWREEPNSSSSPSPGSEFSPSPRH